METAELKAKITAVNRANSAAYKYSQILRANFEPLVGQQVIRTDGRILNRHASLVPDFQNDTSLMVCKRSSKYSLAWSFKACESVGDGSCVYHEVTVYIGVLNGTILDHLDPPFGPVPPYTLENVRKAQEEYAVAKKALEKAEAACHPFAVS